MARKVFLIFTLASLCALAAFSLDASGKANKAADFSLSAGGRIFYNGMFNIGEQSYMETDENTAFINSYLSNLYSNHGFGIGGFFDATYVEIGLDFIFGTFTPNNSGYHGNFELNSTQFGFSLMGKYPVALGSITAFPLLGIDYQILISGEVKPGGSKLKRSDLGRWKDLYDAFSISVGGGVDYNLTSKLYLRGVFLLNFKLDSSFDSDYRKLTQIDGVIEATLFTFGPRFSAGVGYRL